MRGKGEQRAFEWDRLVLEHDEDGYERVRYKFAPGKTTAIGVGRTRSVDDALMYANDRFPDECPVQHFKELSDLRPEGKCPIERFYLCANNKYHIYFNDA